MVDEEPECVAMIYASLAIKKTRPTVLTLRQSRDDSGHSHYDRIESDLLETSLVKLPAKAILGDRRSAEYSPANAKAGLPSKDNFVPAAIPEIETLVHDSLIRQAGVQLQRLTRRDSTRPERDVAEALRHLHLLLWYLTARKRLNPAFMEGESRKRVREVCRNLAEKSLERTEKLLKGKSVPHHAELAQVARGLCRILRDAGIDRTVLGCVWQDGVFGDSLVGAAVELAKSLDHNAASDKRPPQGQCCARPLI